MRFALGDFYGGTFWDPRVLARWQKCYFVSPFYPVKSMSPIDVKESLCVRLLRFLDANQQAGFETYLNCALFNTNASLSKVYDLLRKHALGANSEPLSPQTLFEGTGINSGLYPKYATQLVAQLERFIPFWEQKDDPRHGYADTFAFWQRVGLDQDLMERQYRKMKRKAAKLPPSEWQLFQAFELEHSYLQYKAGHPRKDQASLFESAEASFEELCLIFRIRYHCARLTMERFFPLDANENGFLLAEIDPQRLSLLGQAYYRAAVQLEGGEQSSEAAEAFYHWLREHQTQFSVQDREDLFGFLLNVCIRICNQNAEAQPLLNDVYMEMVEGKLLNHRSQLPGSHFKNIVSGKIKLGDLEGASIFIGRYQNELGIKDRLVLVPYARGLVAYHRSCFREAVGEFRNVLDGQPTDVYWGLEARLMLWRSYYEILDSMDEEEHEEFLRQYDALRIYLSRRGHLTPKQKMGAEHFVRIFNRLAGLKEGLPSARELQTLRKEVMELPTIKQRKWLCHTIDRQLAALKF